MLLKKLKENFRWILLLVVLELVVLAYYWFEWRTFTHFVEAIDHHSQFMQDFVGHYYPMGAQILQNPKPVSGYFYTSFFAIILVPLSTYTLLEALTIWATIQIICLIALCIFSARLLKLTPLGTVLYISLFTTSFPILHNIKWGQVSIFIVLCTVASFLASKQNKSILSGILLGFATAIKLYPAYFIVYFVLKRDVRMLVSFSLSVVIFCFALPATVIGTHNWVEFERLASSAIINADWVQHSVNSQYIVHVGLRLLAIIFGKTAGENISGILSMVGYMIALSSIAVVWLLQKSDLSEKLTLSLVTLFLITPFILKTSWPHYFVYLPLCQAATLRYLALYFHQPNIWRKTIFAFTVASILLSSMFVFNLFSGWTIYNSYGILFLANLLLLVCVHIISAQHSVHLTGGILRQFRAFFYARRLWCMNRTIGAVRLSAAMFRRPDGTGAYPVGSCD